MKKSIVLVVAVLFCLGCSNESSDTDNTIETIEFKTLMHSPVAIEKDGEVRLAVQKREALSTFNQFALSRQLDYKAEDVKIVKVHGKNYLRFYGDNGMVSTLELIKSENNTFITGGTSCESTACADCCGCVPDGLYCTKCTRYDPLPGGPVNDCKRITSSPPVIE
jgi:hypothetical protein